jgi:ABC-type transport system involved in multi-copper enzyme maturation permease subunit
MRCAWVIVGYAWRESVRRRVVGVVCLLTTAFLAVYGVGAWRAFRDADHFVGRDTPLSLSAHDLAGATIFGLSMFATLFLGTVLAVFLTLGAVRGDAERGLLQPLVVRPIGRSALLAARFAAAASVCAVYVGLVYACAVAITGLVGGWWPDRIVLPAIELAIAVAILVALSLLGSVFLSPSANGIATFMVFGGGLVAGLLGQIGHAIHSPTLSRIGKVASWALPFEALYQDGLHTITASTSGFARFALQLGPFGGAQVGGGWLGAWVAAYLALAGGAAALAFSRRDL